MSVETWNECCNYLEMLVSHINDKGIILAETSLGGESDEDNQVTDNAIIIKGNLLIFLEMLEKELYIALQMVQTHTNEYLKWLGNEFKIIKVATLLHIY